MENLKNLLGSAYHEGITVEEINTFLSGKKFVNLKDGGYVDESKYNNLKEKYDNLEKTHNEFKESVKDYETLKTENDNFKTEKSNSELKEKIVKYGIKETAFKYVKGDIDAKELELGEDEKVNQDNVKKYLETHPEFANQTQKQKPFVIRQVGTSVQNDPKNPQGSKSFNDKMHDAFANGK